MNRSKFHKLYFPGLISLIFLPLMSVNYLVENGAFNKSQGMDIAWCSKKLFIKWHIATFRKYEIVNITGNSTRDVTEINNLRNRLKQILIKDDVKNGIMVHFGDKSNYAEFINVLDICFVNLDKGLAFAPYENKIFIGHVHPQPVANSTNQFLFDDIVVQKAVVPEPDFFSKDNIKALLTKVLRAAGKFWPSILAFTIMLLFSFNRRRRFLDLKSFRLVGI